MLSILSQLSFHLTAVNRGFIHLAVLGRAAVYLILYVFVYFSIH